MKSTYLVGNAHIDPVWLWRKEDGMSEVMATFRSALDRMNEFPDFIFTSACAAYYAWVQQVDPNMFEEILRREKEGRWALAGGYWIQPDCNIPSGEAFARQALYSQRYFLQNFGHMPRVGYNVDSFGHNGMMPQLLRASRMDCYVFMRPNQEENPALPDNLFMWCAPDGSCVTAARVLLSYNDMNEQNFARTPYAGQHPALAKALMLTGKAVTFGQPVFCFYGIGNHGGGPSIRTLEKLRDFLPQHPEMGYAAPDALFDHLAQSGLPLQTVQGDLQHHASGCYSANAAIKAANRRAEQSLMMAETLDFQAHKLVGTAPRKDLIAQAWKRLLFNQFHDILAGCCIKSASDEALRAMDGVRYDSGEISMLAAQRISWNVRTTDILSGAAQKNGWILWEKEGEGTPVVIFNPHSFAARCAVQVKVDVAGVADAEGRPLPCQRVRGEHTNGEDRWDTLFLADLPALGYTTVYLYKQQKCAPPMPPRVYAGEYHLENERLRVEFDPATGGIARLYDKACRREMAREGFAGALAIDESGSDTWAHGVFRFDDVVGRFGGAEVRRIENGPLRAAICVRTRYGQSALTQTFFLSADDPCLTVHCRLDFHEKHQIVKLAFPIAERGCEATYSMPYGFLSKPANGLEEPAQQWVVLAGKESGTGMALINDCKYSFSAEADELRMISARSALYADHYGQRDGQGEFLDQGVQTFRYAIYPYQSGDLPHVVRRAALLNQEPCAVLETHHDGTLPNRYSGACIDADNIVCQCVKQAEDGNGAVMRLYETAGLATRCRVCIPMAGFEADLCFRPQEIKTVRAFQDGSWNESDFIEMC